MHEIGELAMHQSIGADRYDLFHAAYLRDETEFKKLNKYAFAQTVSLRGSDSHSEFVAEVFAGLMLGRIGLRQNRMVMEAYRRFGGDKIVEWTS